MRLKHVIISVLSLLFASAALGAETKTQKDYKALAPMFNTAMNTCPEKVWPNYDWNTVNVLMLEKGQAPLLWKGSTNTIETLTESDVPAKIYEQSFQFITFKGEKTLALQSAENPMFKSVFSTFSFSIHETFHKLGQQGWTAYSGARGTFFPFEASPRIYRNRLYMRLQQFFVSKGQDKAALSQAAYWFNKWKTEFPNEYLTSSDTNEGTARYVEWMGAVVAGMGCKATEEKYFDGVLEIIIGMKAEADVSPDTFSLEREGYSIGGISGAILRLITKDSKWYGAAQNGQSPVEYLLKDVTATKDQSIKFLDIQFEATATKQNATVSAKAEEPLRKYASKDYVRVALAGYYSHYRPYGFYQATQLNNVVFMPLASDLTVQTQDWTITAKAESTLFMPIPSPCGALSFVALIPKSEVKGPSLSLANQELEGTWKGRQLVDEQGFTWFCANQK